MKMSLGGVSVLGVTAASMVFSACGGQAPAPVKVEVVEVASETTPASDGEAAAPAEVDPAYTWDLSHMYASPKAWQEAIDAFNGRIPELKTLPGTLGKSPVLLKKALDTYFDMLKELSRLYSYASNLSNENTRDAGALEMKQAAQRTATDFSQLAAFLEPEILEIDARKIEKFLKKEPGLGIYKFYLENILRQKAHTLDKNGEEILAATGLISGTASSLYGLLSNAEIPWPTVTLSDGREVRIDNAGYTRYRSLPNRADRILVFEAFFKNWSKFEQTVGASLGAQLRQDLFYSQVRKYPSCLASALGGANIPEDVFHMLVKSANDNLDTLQRYLKLRGRMLGVDELHYHDAYTSLVPASDRKFPIEEGLALVLDSVRPLGDEYVSRVKEGFENRWMDVYPKEGKSSGAYCNGAAYEVHPYVLMNYTEDYNALSTLTHEFGHAMHFDLANKTQPYPTASYHNFVAEVASTFNEGLLLDEVLGRAKTDDEKLFYLGNALEGLRTTFYRQTMFAEFELIIHTAVEKGEPISGRRLTEIYKELVRRYHGHDKGVMIVDDAYAIEWAYIPHFYYNFYVYQYATSLAASALFVKDVLEEKEGARDRFLNVLKAGGSEHPYQLLKEAGVDLATPAPYEALVARMNGIMDQMEEILDRQ